MRGLNTKLSEMYQESFFHRFSVIAISETWLSGNVSDAEIFDTSFYSVFRCDRDFANTNLSRGGGVCLAVSTEYHPVDLKLKNITAFHNLHCVDIVGVKIRSNYFSCYIFTIYIPPNSPVDTYSDTFDAISSLLILYGSNMILLGDFNIPDFVNSMETSTSSNVICTLNEFMSLFALSQFNSTLNVNRRLLDLVLANFPCDVTQADDPIVRVDAHHPPLVISFTCCLPGQNNKNKTIGYYYNYKRADLVSLYQDLGSTDWNILNKCTDVDTAFALFYETLSFLLDKYVPLVRSHTRRFPPWYNSDIIKLIKKKDKCLQKFRRTGDMSSFNEYKSLRSTIKTKTSQEHKSHCQKIEGNIRSDSKNFWQYVSYKQRNHSIPSSMMYKDSSVDDYQNISNTFGEFFSESYNASCAPKNIIDDTSSNNTLLLGQLCEADIFRSLKKLKPKNTMGPDKIPAFLLHDCASVLSTPLTLLFNLALKNSIFPLKLKQSKIIPIFKKGDKSCIENYRPITICNNVSKVFEIALYKPIYSHVRNLLTQHQHGFVKGRSTSTNLFHITEFLSTALDNHLQVDVIYTDLSKAFDKLDHNILLSTLSSFGFPPNLVTFFRSYLANRTQYVECHGFKSSEFICSSGVPQGSILGPLFFCMFINNIIENINVRYLLYADDLKIFSIIESISDCETLQEAFKQVSRWCLNNKMLLNINKCEIVSFTTKRNYISFDYAIEDKKIPRSNSFKDLGVTFDRELSFIPHIHNVISDASRMLGFIIRTSKDFSEPTTRTLLYFSFVRAKLEYCSIIWSPHYSIHIQNLERIQRKFLKFAAFKEDGVYPHIGFPQEELLRRFSVSSLEHRRITSELIFLHKILHGQIECADILQMFEFRTPRSATRLTQLFYPPAARTNLKKHSPLSRICNHYNECSNLDIFACNIATIKNR